MLEAKTRNRVSRRAFIIVQQSKREYVLSERGLPDIREPVSFSGYQRRTTAGFAAIVGYEQNDCNTQHRRSNILPVKRNIAV